MAQMSSYNKSWQGPMYNQDYYGNVTLTTRVHSQHSFVVHQTNTGDWFSPTPHAYTKVKQTSYQGTYEYRYAGRTNGKIWGSHPYVFTVGNYYADAFEYSAEAAALSEAFEKLRGNIDLSVDLVQWRQAVNMMSGYRRIVRRIAQSAHDLVPVISRVEVAQQALSRHARRRNLGRRRAKRLARELNDSLNYLARKRLEYVYGWSPLMSTIHGLAESVTNPREPGWLRCEGKGRVLTQKTFSNYQINPKVPVVTTTQTSDRCRMVLYFNPAKSVMDDLGRISSLNPVAILYEATPFSFVLDWVWDIGGWIRNLETAFLHRNDYVGGFKTLTKRVSIESLCVGTEVATWDKNANYIYDLKAVAVVTKLSRQSITTVPLQVRPQTQFTFGVGRQLNAIVLAKATLLRADSLLSGRR